ncbi:MAG: alpha-L-fucosidase [Clostridia bacterium]|nr:alpha-L-fucosidase [Clostridia bacterium]
MKKKRENSFFGIHFDFHAMEGETVARSYHPEVIAELLDYAKPDFVQCDTKGHPGLSSYPTKAGTQAFKINKDILKMWRDLTEERDIALYGHHSGLFDMTVIKNHPDWAVKDENGKINDRFVSPFSPYVDEVLIPQIKELALDYKLDGAWIDGECWGSYVDYSDWAVNKYYAETGKKPAKRGDADYEEYRNFCRKGFTDYVQHYVDEIKKVRPDFEITSNWIFSSYMPQKPDVSVDFLSGDYDCFNAVASARVQGRAISNRGYSWDLISWGQNAIPLSWITRNRCTKEYVQYCQEAAEVISQGGGFQFFNIIYDGGGSIQKWALPTWKKVADFVHEREYCFRSKPVKEIAVLFAEATTPHDTDSLFGHPENEFGRLNLWVQALQNNQFSSNVINEYHLYENELNNYEILIIPDSEAIKASSAEIIKEYIKNGGKVICDLKSNKYFSDITGINDLTTENKLIFVDGISALAAMEVDVLKENYELSRCAEFYDENFYDEKPHAAAYMTEYGKGKLISLCFDFSEAYEENISAALDDFLKNQLKTLDFTPIVETDNAFVDVVTMQKNGDMLVNLINYSGTHAIKSVRTYRQIPPLYNIDVKINTQTKPEEVYLEPGHIKCDFEYKNNQISLTVDKIDVHKTVVVKGIMQ